MAIEDLVFKKLPKLKTNYRYIIVSYITGTNELMIRKKGKGGCGWEFIRNVHLYDDLDILSDYVKERAKKFLVEEKSNGN